MIDTKKVEVNKWYLFDLLITIEKLQMRIDALESKLNEIESLAKLVKQNTLGD